MTKIAPAILVHDIDDYRMQLRIVRQLTNRFQLDIIDSEFVEGNQTIGLDQLEKPTDLKLDIQLMVVHPGEHLANALRLKPNLIVLQHEIEEAIEPHLEVIKKAEIRTGIAINPATKIEDVKQRLALVDHVLLMGVTAGFAGQEFDARNLRKAKTIRELAPSVEIGWDGAVTDDTTRQIAKAGIDIIYVNSYIFASDDPLSRYAKLLELIG